MGRESGKMYKREFVKVKEHNMKVVHLGIVNNR